MALLAASTSKPKPITQDALMNMMHQKTNAGIKRTLHVQLIYMLSLWYNSIYMPLGPRSPGLRALYLTSTHTLAPLAHLCCQKCLYSTLRLKLVPLTHTRVWRNELYLLLCYNQLGLCCPKILGSLSLGAIPPHMSGLLAMVAHHLPSLTGNLDLSLAQMAAALEPT